jgi:hypothetical protein
VLLLLRVLHHCPRNDHTHSLTLAPSSDANLFEPPMLMVGRRVQEDQCRRVVRCVGGVIAVLLLLVQSGASDGLFIGTRRIRLRICL